MARRRRIPASEAVEKLSQDFAYQAMLARQMDEQSDLAAECAADERECVQDIRRLGYDIDSVWDLVDSAPHPVLARRFVGPYHKAYAVLILQLHRPHHPRVREGIIRALTVRDGGVALERALLVEFNGETDRSLRWVLANALTVAMPYHRRRKHPEIAAVHRGDP